MQKSQPKHPEELTCPLLIICPLQYPKLCFVGSMDALSPSCHQTESQQCQTERVKDYVAYSAEVKLCSFSDCPLKPQLLESCEYTNISAFLFKVYLPPLECREKL